MQAARRAGAVPEAAGPPLPACPPDDRRALPRAGRSPPRPDPPGRAPRPAGGVAARPHRGRPRRAAGAPGRPGRPHPRRARAPAGRGRGGRSGRGLAVRAPPRAGVGHRAVDGPRGEAWERGEPAERIEALRRLRSADPAAARGLLATGLPGERAELRAAAYGTLAAGPRPGGRVPPGAGARRSGGRGAPAGRRAAGRAAGVGVGAAHGQAGGPHGRDPRAGRARPLRDRPRRAGPSQLGPRRHRRGRVAGHVPRRPRPAPGRRRDAARVVGGAGAAPAPPRAGGRARAGSGAPVRVEHGGRPPAGRPLGARSSSARRPSRRLVAVLEPADLVQLAVGAGRSSRS